MNIGDYLKSVGQVPISCHRNDSTQDVANKLSENGIGAMPVLSADGMLVGMLSERDLVRAYSKHGPDFAMMTVNDMLTEYVHFMGPGADLSEAMKVMNKHGFRHIPVLDEGKLLGVISIRDVLALAMPHNGTISDHPVLAVATS